jgi:hypothetical protein
MRLFPMEGGYGAFEYLNWAAKFTIDANVKELVRGRRECPKGGSLVR